MGAKQSRAKSGQSQGKAKYVCVFLPIANGLGKKDTVLESSSSLHKSVLSMLLKVMVLSPAGDLKKNRN